MSQRVSWTEKQYEEWLKKNPHQGGVKLLTDPKPLAYTKPWPRQERSRKTKVEVEFELRLKASHPKATIYFEAVRLVLGERCVYTPDFWVPELLCFFEVKGPYMHEDSLIKWKTARTIHSWARFELWQKKGGWRKLY